MTEESDLYTQNARDCAEQSQYWARQAQRAAHQIDLPAAMSLTLALNLLLTCLMVSAVKAQITQHVEAHHAQCQR